MERNLNKCYLCNCLKYPDCEDKIVYKFDSESCENCIDGACGFHKKIDQRGVGMADIPDTYEMCPNCGDYCDVEEMDCHNDLCCEKS